MDRSQDWATRLHHEAQLHERTCFITLTFSDENYPWDGSVSVRDIQLFTKRLRKAVSPTRIRFFACGEYGDENARPHYHLLVFGWDDPAKTLWRRTPSGFLVYRSELLERVWPFGHVELGTVSHKSAGYVARYCLKKVTGNAADAHYTRPHALTGEFHQVRAEFICMSNKPGIGHGWAEKYTNTDAFPKDFLIVDGKRRPVPKYYFRKYKEKEAQHALALASTKITANRKKRASQHKDNNTPSRLATREAVLARRTGQLKRSI